MEVAAFSDIEAEFTKRIYETLLTEHLARHRRLWSRRSRRRSRTCSGSYGLFGCPTVD